jgi:hypothetical protein
LEEREVFFERSGLDQQVGVERLGFLANGFGDGGHRGLSAGQERQAEMGARPGGKVDKYRVHGSESSGAYVFGDADHLPIGC